MITRSRSLFVALPALLIAAAPLSCGSSESSETSETAIEEPVALGEQSEAVTSSQLLGYWERQSSGAGPIRYVELTDLIAPASSGAPAGAKTLVMRSDAYPDEFVGAYVLTNANNLRLYLWGENAGPPSYAGDWNLTQGASGCSSCIVMRKGAVTTNITKITSPLSVGGVQQPVAIVTPASVNGAGTEVSDYAAMEIARHLRRALGSTPLNYISEKAAFLASALPPNSRRIYVGNTVFAQKIGATALATSKESWVNLTVGQSVVLYGPESGRAAQPSAIPWAAGEAGLRFRPGKKPYAQYPDDPNRQPFDLVIPSGNGLFSRTAGGTMEMWIRDDDPLCSTQNQTACWNYSFLSVLRGYTYHMNVMMQNTPSGLWLGFGLPKSGVAKPNVQDLRRWEPTSLIPRDGAMHHISVSFEPTTPVTVKLYVDGRMEQGTIPETGPDSLDFVSDLDQNLRVDGDDSSLSATLYGLRFAAKSTTQAEHDGRPLTSMRSLTTGDQVLFNFLEGSGLPINKANTAYDLVPPAPTNMLSGERGTLHAAYEWLQRVAGVRWYMPGNLGVAYKALSSLSLTRGKYVMANPLRYRYTQAPHHFTPPLHVSMDALGELFEETDRKQWSLRVGLGGEPVQSNHSFYDLKRLDAEAHPEWFSPVSVTGQPCFNNAGFNSAVNSAVTAYAGSPDDYTFQTTQAASAQRFPMARDGWFALGPMDGDVLRGQPASDCNVVTARSRGQFNTPNPPTGFFSSEASEYMFDFYNRVSAGVGSGAARPVKFSALAYMDFAFPPQRAIASNVSPMVTFGLQNWASDTTSRSLINAWATKAPAAGFNGWTYMFDSASGRYTSPKFDYRAIADAARQVVAKRSQGFTGLQFEHSTSWDGDSAANIISQPLYQQMVADFRGFRDMNRGSDAYFTNYLWDRWPLSLSALGYAGWPSFFACKAEKPSESQIPAYTPYCQRFSQMPVEDFNRFALTYLGAATAARSIASSQLDLYFLLRRMSEPVAVGSNPVPPAMDVEAEITRYFDTYFGTGSAEMRRVYDRLAALPAENTGCTDPFSSEPWAKCAWSRRFSHNTMLSLHNDLQAAKSKIGSDKRFRAFTRNVWCTIVRAYYEYSSEAGSDRTNDAFRVKEVCADDSSLKRYISYNGDRFLAE